MTQVLINGQWHSQIEQTDRGFQYGDGLFETMAYRNGQILFWREHLQRLNYGCERLDLPAVSEQQWLDDLKQLKSRLNTPQAVIKLILTRGSSGRGYNYLKQAITATRVVAQYPWPQYPESFSHGVRLRLCKTPVSVNTALAGIKHLNRLDNVLARHEWQDPDIAEGIMLDDAQNVIEGTMSNIFMVKNNILLTPSLTRAGVEGIIRNKIINLARQNSIEVQESLISHEDLLSMDEVFITNSLIGVWPVNQIENSTFDQHVLSQKFSELLKQDTSALEI